MWKRRKLIKRNLTVDDLKKVGVEELADIVDNINTIFNAGFTPVERVTAFLELISGLDLPTKKSLDKIATAWEARKGSLGSYTIWFNTGERYHGKGSAQRMLDSVKEREALFPRRKAVSMSHRPTLVDEDDIHRNAFKEEAIRLYFIDDGPLNGTLNQIDQPGLKYIINDGF